LDPAVVSGGVCRCERRTQPHGNQHQEDLIGDGSDEWLYRAREELGKCKCLARITAEGGVLCRVEVGEHSLVESEIGPAGKESKDGKPQSSSGQERREREKENSADVDERKSRNSERYDTAEEGYGMRWDELAESDKESNLNGNGSSNDSQATQLCQFLFI
jgi:hypothetical protein